VSDGPVLFSPPQTAPRRPVATRPPDQKRAFARLTSPERHAARGISTTPADGCRLSSDPTLLCRRLPLENGDRHACQLLADKLANTSMRNLSLRQPSPERCELRGCLGRREFFEVHVFAEALALTEERFRSVPRQQAAYRL
jgi:hypothetical protein